MSGSGSNFEEILLAIERERFPLDGLTRRIAALEQGLMASWMYAAFTEPPIQGNCVDAFATGGVDCPCIPFVMPFFIGGMGYGTVTWNGSSPSDPSGYWAGCLMYNRAATAGCTVRTIPVFVSVFPNPISPESTFRVGWIDTSGTCPDAGKTCADVAAVDHIQERTDAFTDCTGGIFGIQSDLFLSQNDLTGGFSTLTYSVNAGNFSPCLSVWLPQTVSFVDSLYGAGTLTYDLATARWKGCIAGISYPGYTTCVARTIAIQYELTSDGFLVVKCANTSGCPTASTCTTAAGTTFTINPGATPPVVTCEAGGNASYTVPIGAGTNGQKLYRNTPSTIKILFP